MKVKINWDLLNADLERHGITKTELSESLGMGRNYITNMGVRTGGYKASTVHRIERAMLKPKGTYCIEKTMENMEAMERRKEMTYGKVNWEKLDADMMLFGLTGSQLSRKLGKSGTWLNTTKNNEAKRGHISIATIAKIEDAMFQERGSYLLEGSQETSAKSGNLEEMEQIIRILNEQLIEMKVLRQGLASMKEELLSVQNAIRDKVAFTHTAVTSVRENIGEIKKQLE